MIRSRKCLWARTFNFRWTHSFFCHEFEGVCEYIRFQFCNLILHFMVSSCRVIFISQWMQFSSMNIHKSCTFRTFSTSTGYTQSLIHSCSFFFVCEFDLFFFLRIYKVWRSMLAGQHLKWNEEKTAIDGFGELLLLCFMPMSISFRIDAWHFWCCYCETTGSYYSRVYDDTKCTLHIVMTGSSCFLLVVFFFSFILFTPKCTGPIFSV